MLSRTDAHADLLGLELARRAALAGFSSPPTRSVTSASARSSTPTSRGSKLRSPSGARGSSTCLSADPLTVDPGEIPSPKIRATMVDGELVHRV